MKINKLLKKIGYEKRLLNNHKVADVFSDSKECVYNSIFVCIKGNKFDGHDYIKEAIKNGAKTIIYQDNIIDYQSDINYLKVEDTKKLYALLLKNLYDDITKDMILIGVTGTNGKTSTTSLISSFLDYKNINNIYIGTHFIKYLNCSYSTKNTTPDIKVIYQHLKIAKDNNVKYVVMEVSSIAVAELRVLGLNFTAFGLTNITTDHLDYHKTFDNYRYAKLLAIFNIKKDGHLILNKDCLNSFSLFNKYHLNKTITYSLKDANSDIYINEVYKNITGLSFKLNNNHLKTPLIGDFNLCNIMCAFGIIKALNFNIRDFKAFIKQYAGIKGRGNVIVKDNKNIIIDYAHTQVAVESILKEASSLDYKKITVVIGCGGDRDKSKRAPIGRLLNKYAGKIILTNDNPRSEDELSIINDIAYGISKDYIVIPCRYNAIKEAVDNASRDEIVCILGKGDENTQVFKDKTIEFNDFKVVNELLGITHE